MDTETKKRTPPGTPKYHRLTGENRIIIWTLKKEGKLGTYIAARIGCSVSTISRELDRNKGKKGLLREAVPFLGARDEREPQRRRAQGPAQGQRVRRHPRRGDEAEARFTS